MNVVRQLEFAIVKGNVKKATALTKRCLQEGHSPLAIMEKGILKGIEVVGEKWKTYEYFIPNVLVSAMATKLSLNAIHASLKTSVNRYGARAVAGTVKGDVHDIGKNIVLMFMDAAGIEVIDLGIDVSPEHFIRAVRKEKPDLLLLSCLYTVTMHAMEDTVIALRKAGLKGRVKTIVGGAPITQEFADSIGADGFGVDAMEGVKRARELLKDDKSYGKTGSFPTHFWRDR